MVIRDPESVPKFLGSYASMKQHLGSELSINGNEPITVRKKNVSTRKIEMWSTEITPNILASIKPWRD